jgi:hypothetical protein
VYGRKKIKRLLAAANFPQPLLLFFVSTATLEESAHDDGHLAMLTFVPLLLT